VTETPRPKPTAPAPVKPAQAARKTPEGPRPLRVHPFRTDALKALRKELDK